MDKVDRRPDENKEFERALERQLDAVGGALMGGAGTIIRGTVESATAVADLASAAVVKVAEEGTAWIRRSEGAA
ncbi:hypothetical protein [Micromonospora marina]|uniref:hypothetical protein n=1 Tax=Micromonospora marina TaxID=307120 RepID=UPI00345304E3